MLFPAFGYEQHVSSASQRFACHGKGGASFCNWVQFEISGMFELQDSVRKLRNYVATWQDAPASALVFINLHTACLRTSSSLQKSSVAGFSDSSISVMTWRTFDGSFSLLRPDWLWYFDSISRPASITNWRKLYLHGDQSTESKTAGLAVNTRTRTPFCPTLS